MQQKLADSTVVNSEHVFSMHSVWTSDKLLKACFAFPSSFRPPHCRLLLCIHSVIFWLSESLYCLHLSHSVLSIFRLCISYTILRCAVYCRSAWLQAAQPRSFGGLSKGIKSHHLLATKLFRNQSSCPIYCVGGDNGRPI